MQTIDQAKEAAIRADERRVFAAEVQAMLNEKLAILSEPGGPCRRARYEGHVTAYSAVLARLGERA